MKSNRRVEIIGKRIRIYFPYNEELYAVVEALPDRGFEKPKKSTPYWWIPITAFHAEKVIEALAPLQFDIDKKIVNLAKERKPKQVAIKDKPPGLYPFQVEGVKFLVGAGGRAILGDEMGLGKTPQALGFCHVAKSKKVLIVSPASIIYKWRDEVDRWLGWPVQVVEKTSQALTPARVYIMSYTIMTRRHVQLSKMGFDTLIADEAHYIKNHRTQRSLAMNIIITHVPHILLLTGTPFKNRPKELFNLLHTVKPSEWPSFFPYGKRYCAGEETEMGWNFDGVSNESELQDRLKSVMIRRLKTDVLDQLPDLTRTKIPVKLSKKHRDAYATARIKAMSNGTNKLAALVSLRQVVGLGKVQVAREWAEDFLNDSSEKLVIFAHHKAVVSAMADALMKYGVTKIVGDVSTKKRHKAVTAFQNNPLVRVMIISQAGGEGIDLFAASNILFVEREWTPADEEQIEARLHRIGQKSAVNAWYLVAQQTMDERMDIVIEDKRQVFKDVLTAPDILTEIIDEVYEAVRDE